MVILLGANSSKTLRRTTGLLLLLALICGMAYWFGNRETSTSELLAQARTAYERQDYHTAEKLANRALAQNPDEFSAALLAGRAASGLQQFSKAVSCFEQIPDIGTPVAVTARCESGNVLLMELKRPAKAQAQYLRAVKQAPENVIANFRLAYLLGLGGRSRDAIPYRLKLIDLEQIEATQLYLLSKGETALENVEQVQKLQQASPDDPLVLLGLAMQALNKQEMLQAEKLLKQVIAQKADTAAAYIKLGELLLENDRETDFLKWYQTLPSNLEKRPGLWVLRGKWATQHSQIEAAMRCYWEAIRIDPNHQQANYQLAQLLISTGRAEDAKPFLNRSELLQQYNTIVKDAWTGQNMESAHKAMKLAQRLGLLREAYAWAWLVNKHQPHLAWSQKAKQQLKPQISGLALSRSIAKVNPAAQVNLSALPLPEMMLEDTPSKPTKLLSVQSEDQTQIQFVDQAKDAGLIFSYFNGAERDQQTRRMYEFNGGGVAIIDYDCDGWSDIYLTQGSSWPNASEQKQHYDRLFRNLGNGQFVDVTVQAGIAENSFSAGVTVGDYNNDGFLDLYVANIGDNRFYCNNGDGTFSDVTALSKTAGHAWSTSCLLADLNGDSLPDLYVVNYLQGDDIFTRICPDENKKPHSCIPANFSGATDQLYQNMGDGTFRNITESSGLQPEGKGLGILAADFNGTGMLDLFIANDAEPNFYYQNHSNAKEKNIKLVEQALISGLALNESGQPEACMGVAAGDANEDGRLDLFVTNFYNESNTLYLNQGEDLFQDNTRASQLYDASLKMLGFGTQFLDADLDGDLDLILTNGHIDDLSNRGEPFQMPSQFFRNIGRGQFTPLSAEGLGPYFRKKHLGRGMARIDWNRDGLEDILISHLDSPVALLTNKTKPAGHYLSVNLRGVASSRDAIGTILTVKAGEQILVRQLTAGDGFQASNERRILFGLGKENEGITLQIRWPSGLVQVHENLPADSELLLIEGRSYFLVTDSL